MDQPPATDDTARPRLPLARYRLHFHAEGRPRLPPYTGSAWRGAFGHALRTAACATGAPSCGGCLLYSSCVYAYLFETAPPPDSAKMRRYNRVPHPFVLRPLPPAPAGRHGTDQQLLLTVFGRANDQLAYFVHSLQGAGNGGIGAGRTPMTLTAVEQEAPPGSDRWTTIHVPGQALSPLPPAPPPVPVPPRRVTLELQTPLRLQSKGRPVGPDRLLVADLAGNLLRRISMLTHFHTDTPLETDFAGLMSRARRLAWTRAEFHWHDWARYSSRQSTRVPMGGLLGSAALEGAALGAFWPYLWLGQWCHAGKGTSMGLGAYRLSDGKLGGPPATEAAL